MDKDRDVMIDLTQEEQRLIELARKLSSSSDFSLEEELAQMKKARVIGISSAYRHTYFYHRARIEPLYEGREVEKVKASTRHETAKREKYQVAMRHLS